MSECDPFQKLKIESLYSKKLRIEYRLFFPTSFNEGDTIPLDTRTKGPVADVS